MAPSRLKIAMLSVHSCPVGNLGARDTGGMSVYIRELAQELDKQGHSVDIYTRVHDPRDPYIIQLGQNARLVHLFAGGYEEINKLDIYPHLPDFAENLEIFRKQYNLQYDLIFSHYWLSGWVGEYLRQRWHIPHITMFHTLGAVKNAIGIGEPEPELRIETERELARNCLRIIAPTEREKGNLVRYYGASPEKIGIVPCGVNPERFKPMDREIARRQLGLNDEKIILFVGRLDPLKGIDNLLKAVSYLKDTQSIKLVLIGGDKNSPQEMEELGNIAQELRIQDSVSFPGLIKQEQLPYFYSAADVCVVPSHYESFGMVALESLACGTPVVATDVGDLKNIIRQRDAGYVIRDNSPHLLADYISLILSRHKTDAESASSIRASISRFDWQHIAEAVIRESQAVLADYCAPVP